MNNLNKAKVSSNFYWIEEVLLFCSIVAPIIVLVKWDYGDMLERSGSITVLLAAIVQFRLLNKANTKHINNAIRQQNSEAPLDFSWTSIWVGWGSLLCAILGTLLWGFGKPLMRYWGLAVDGC